MLNQTKVMSALMCVLAAYLSGCAIVESAQPLNVENEKKPALLTTKANEVALVLAFFQRIRGLPADSLAADSHSDALIAIDVSAAHDVENGTPVWMASTRTHSWSHR